MPEQTTNFAIEWVLTYLWIPALGWIMGSARKQQQDNKERDELIGKLSERAAVLEATRMTREDVTEVIEAKFDKLEDKIDKLSDHVNGVTSILMKLPKRSGEE